MSASHIKSARQYGLLIVGLGIVALQMGWSVYEREQRYQTISYIEKIIAVTNEIAIERLKENGKAFEKYFTPADTYSFYKYPKVIDIEKLVEIGYVEPINKFILPTKADPAAICNPYVFRNHAVIGLTIDDETSIVDSYIYMFPDECLKIQKYIDPVITTKAFREGELTGIVREEKWQICLPDQVYQLINSELGGGWRIQVIMNYWTDL
jgi:hypothetical protein